MKGVVLTVIDKVKLYSKALLADLFFLEIVHSEVTFVAQELILPVAFNLFILYFW